MGIKKGDGQLDSLESPALPREDKERRDESGALSKSVHDGPDLVFTMTRIRCSRWAGFDVHDGPENAKICDEHRRIPTQAKKECEIAGLRIFFELCAKRKAGFIARLSSLRLAWPFRHTRMLKYQGRQGQP